MTGTRVGVWLLPPPAERLDELARASCQSRSATLRALVLAATLPEDAPADPDERNVLELLGHGPPAALFPSRIGTHLAHGAVWWHGHAVAMKGSGVAPKLRIHDLGHSTATLWLAAGESIDFVQQQLGHADIRTTIS